MTPAILGEAELRIAYLWVTDDLQMETPCRPVAC